MTTIVVSDKLLKGGHHRQYFDHAESRNRLVDLIDSVSIDLPGSCFRVK